MEEEEEEQEEEEEEEKEKEMEEEEEEDYLLHLKYIKWLYSAFCGSYIDMK